jgi:hypothetical protein
MTYCLTHTRQKCLVHDRVIILDDAYNATHKLNTARTNDVFFEDSISLGILFVVLSNAASQANSREARLRIGNTPRGALLFEAHVPDTAKAAEKP